MSRVGHAHVRKCRGLIDGFRIPGTREVVVALVLEWAPRGALCDFLEVSRRALPLDEARAYFHQILTGIAACHEVRLVIFMFRVASSS